MEKLTKELSKLKNAKILDVGTGGGAFVSLISDIYDDYQSIVGIDTHKRAIEAARKSFEKSDRISFKEVDLLDTDFKDGEFDVVCLSNTIHHLVDIEPVFKEMLRLVSADGFILINEMISDNLDSMQKSHMLLHHYAAEIDRELGVYHGYTYRKEEMISILEKYSDNLTVWEMDIDRVTENTKEEMEWVDKTIDMLINRTKDFENYLDFVERGNVVREYIKSNGYDRATSVVAMMRRPNK